MTYEEAKEVIKKLKEETNDSEEVMAQKFYLMYADGKIDENTMKSFMALVGWQPKEEFSELPEEEKKSLGAEGEEDEEEKANKLFGFPPKQKEEEKEEKGE